MDDEVVMIKQLDSLREKHRQLDEKISSMAGDGVPDQLTVVRLKKEKLMLRDRIIRLEETIYPDIIA